MDPVEVKEQVNKAIDDGGAAPVPVPEVVSSPEVKVESPKETVSVDKLQEQINNLNIALKQERESGRATSEKAKQFEEQLQKSNQVIERLEEVFVPEKKVIEEEKQYMTKEEADAFFQQKLEEQKQLTFKEKQTEIIKSEIAILEKDWNGADGRPKYVDEEVLKWQQENQKLYLTPVEAFNQMKKNEIIDWEVKQRLSGKKKVENVEQPGISPDVHTPAENLPKTEKELQDAVRAAIDAAEAEM